MHTPTPELPGLDLSPAKWVWWPGGRSLANTVVLFRREFHATAGDATTLRLTADSRYIAYVNGERLGFGPAPCDPRRLDVDAYDLTPMLRTGVNVLAVEVLFYGHGEGTWAAGAPGLIARIEQGGRVLAATDAAWLCHLDRSRRPGMYRRFYLRSLQEVRDERLRPQGWTKPGYVPEDTWLPAAELPVAAHLPAVFGSGRDYAFDTAATDTAEACLIAREIPMPVETELAATARAAHTLRFRRDPDDWFEQRTLGTVVAEPIDLSALQDGSGYALPASDARTATAITFAFDRQLLGFEFVELDAPEGTIVELMPQEAHDPSGPALLDTHAFSWSRYICGDANGRPQRFEVADYDCLRWLQVSVRGASRPVRILRVGIRQREHPGLSRVSVSIDDPALQRLFDASVNTLRLSCVETAVDGMGRERQQYSGDCGHQLAVFSALTGDLTVYRRFLQTWSMGLTRDGYFLDCWPAFDRLNRLGQRQVGLTPWGPILDHGVGFAMDVLQYHRQSGDLGGVREPFRRLVRFFDYLRQHIASDGLLPTDGYGVPTVWIDHDAYRRAEEKRLAWNLYTAHSSRFAMAPLAERLGEDAGPYHELAERLVKGCERYYRTNLGCYANVLPPDEARFDDRSLSHAVLAGLNPAGDAATLERLASMADTGLSYPANAVWRLAALWRGGRSDVVLRELRERWAVMPSVRENLTLSEFWKPRPDTRDQWSHCAVGPLWALVFGAAEARYDNGVLTCRPNEARLRDWPAFEVRLFDGRGPVSVKWDGGKAMSSRP